MTMTIQSVILCSQKREYQHFAHCICPTPACTVENFQNLIWSTNIDHDFFILLLWLTPIEINTQAPAYAGVRMKQVRAPVRQNDVFAHSGLIRKIEHPFHPGQNGYCN